MDVISGCWNREILVPWKDSCALVELGLWSILSTAAVVKSLPLSCRGHTDFRISYWWLTLCQQGPAYVFLCGSLPQDRLLMVFPFIVPWLCLVVHVLVPFSFRHTELLYMSKHCATTLGMQISHKKQHVSMEEGACSKLLRVKLFTGKLALLSWGAFLFFCPLELCFVVFQSARVMPSGFVKLKCFHNARTLIESCQINPWQTVYLVACSACISSWLSEVSLKCLPDK